MSKVIAALVNARDRSGAWPAYNGKKFVLSIAVSGALSPTTRFETRVFFSPIDPDRRSREIDVVRYKELSLDRREAGDDIGDLTSFAGRRNATPGFELAPFPGPDEPLLADDYHPGFVLIGYADGTIRRHTYAELGIQATPGRVRMGKDAMSSLLRKLSKE